MGFISKPRVERRIVPLNPGCPIRSNLYPKRVEFCCNPFRVDSTSNFFPGLAASFAANPGLCYGAPLFRRCPHLGGFLIPPALRVVADSIMRPHRESPGSYRQSMSRILCEAAFGYTKLHISATLEAAA
jgi:hypothetical protein